MVQSAPADVWPRPGRTRPGGAVAGICETVTRLTQLVVVWFWVERVFALMRAFVSVWVALASLGARRYDFPAGYSLDPVDRTTFVLPIHVNTSRRDVSVNQALRWFSSQAQKLTTGDLIIKLRSSAGVSVRQRFRDSDIRLVS